MAKVAYHDPSAHLDYRWDWGRLDAQGNSWLGEDTILTADVTCSDPAVDIENPVATDGRSVTAIVSGGTSGTNVSLTCRITTQAGRQDERTILLRVRNR